jgi:hypothetical protein
VAALALAAVASAPAAKGPLAVWLPSSTLAARSTAPLAGIGGDGTAVVVWAPGDGWTAGQAGATRARRAARWGAAPVAAAEGVYRRSDDLGVGAAGDAVFLGTILRQPCQSYRDNCYRTVQAMSRTPSGSWSTPLDISNSAYDAFLHGGGGDEASVAVDGTGGAVAAWISWDGGANSLVAASRRNRAGAWSAPFTLWGGQLSGLEAAANVAGSALVAFTTYDGTQSVVRAVRRPGAAAAWLAPDVLGGGTVSSLTQADVAANGDAVVGWCNYRGTSLPRGYQAAVFSGGRWTTADLPLLGDCADSKPTLALQPGGRVLAIWKTSREVIVAAFSSADLRTWSKPAVISAWKYAATGDRPVVAVGPAGHVLATWQLGALYARMWDPKTKRWSATTVLDDHKWTVLPAVAVDSKGQAVVAWLRSPEYLGTEGQLRARTLVLRAKR